MSERNYYAIIPADVRYADIQQGAKLLYGELTALSNEKGYCWASNDYFAELYKTDKRTIQRWFNALEKGGFITKTILCKEGSKEISERRIYLSGVVTKMSWGGDKNVMGGGDKNVTHNNTDINNTYELKEKSIKEKSETKTKGTNKFVPPTLEEVTEYCSSRNNNIDPQYFIDYYEARNWELSKGRKVKNWQACVRTWERRSNEFDRKPRIEISEEQRKEYDSLTDEFKFNV